MANVTIIFGSTYGHAEAIALACTERLQELGHKAELLTEPDINQLVADETEVILVCTATIGGGELPINLRPLYAEFQRLMPYLPNKKYGLIALGDSSYEDFANGGELIQNLFEDLSLERIGDICRLDASEGADHEDEALAWLDDWSARL